MFIIHLNESPFYQENPLPFKVTVMSKMPRVFFHFVEDFGDTEEVDLCILPQCRQEDFLSTACSPNIQFGNVI